MCNVVFPKTFSLSIVRLKSFSEYHVFFLKISQEFFAIFFLTEFDDYFMRLNVHNHTRTNPWFGEYWEKHFDCVWSPDHSDVITMADNNKSPCTGIRSAFYRQSAVISFLLKFLLVLWKSAASKVQPWLTSRWRKNESFFVANFDVNATEKRHKKATSFPGRCRLLMTQTQPLRRFTGFSIITRTEVTITCYVLPVDVLVNFILSSRYYVYTRTCTFTALLVRNWNTCR